MQPTIAVIGASADRSKFGNKCVRAYLQKGYRVFPVNPRETTIEGQPAFASIRDVPVETLDRVSLYLAPPLLAKILPDLASITVKEVWFNPGTDTPELLSAARDLGLHAIPACSIVAIGVSPEDMADA